MLNNHDVLDFWPIALVAAGGLVAWGRMHARLDGHDKSLDDKVSKGEFGQVNDRLGRIEKKLDAVIERRAEPRD